MADSPGQDRRKARRASRWIQGDIAMTPLVWATIALCAVVASLIVGIPYWSRSRARATPPTTPGRTRTSPPGRGGWACDVGAVAAAARHRRPAPRRSGGDGPRRKPSQSGSLTATHSPCPAGRRGRARLWAHPCGRAPRAHALRVSPVRRVTLPRKMASCRRAEPDLLQVLDRGADVTGPALGVERAVGAEQDVVGAVEVDAAAHRVGGPEHRGVAVHHPEVLDGPRAAGSPRCPPAARAGCARPAGPSRARPGRRSGAPCCRRGGSAA